jgi:hypothetical protein
MRIDPDFSVRHSERPSKRASGSRAMKVYETKEVLAKISPACISRRDWHGGKPGSSRLQDAQTRLRRLDLSVKNPLIISAFMGISPGGRMIPGREQRAEKSAILQLPMRPMMLFFGSLRNIHRTRGSMLKRALNETRLFSRLHSPYASNIKRENRLGVRSFLWL